MMIEKFTEMAQICSWDTTTQFLLVSENVFSKLIYYSHLLPAGLSILLAIFVIQNNPKRLANRLLFAVAFVFTLWSLFDLVLWASERPDYIMFFWSALAYWEPLIYALTFYLVYVIVRKKDISFDWKAIGLITFIPVLILAPTAYNIVGFDFTNCEREVAEGVLWNFIYALEIFYVLLISWVCVKGFKDAEGKERRKIAVMATGVLVFLATFSWGNILGTITVDWTVAQYGLFGMPVFIAVLAYLTVKYRTFDVKLIGTQALVIGQWVLLFAILLIPDLNYVRAIIAISLMLLFFFGTELIKSVKKEVEDREKIEHLAERLADANERLKELDQQKSEFVSLASHQLRSPLTAIKGYSSMLIEGSYGKFEGKAHDILDRIFQSSQRLVVIIEDFLNLSRIEQGKMEYEKTNFDLCELVNEVVKEMEQEVKSNNLSLNFEKDHEGACLINADRGKIQQVITNLVDNSVKYTNEGGITISLKTQDDRVRVEIKDTGIGIKKDLMPKLFRKFSRVEGEDKGNIKGTGLGLFVAKKIMDAHEGKIGVISEGEGKGSTFYLEFNRTV